ncbi:MAG: pyruvoyl-dependent arginine decarboxylase [Candidatus Odinarchaeia archaeon]
MIAKSFFVVKGVGLSQKSKVNAFDAALINAGLENVNLINVSSIIPPDAKEDKPHRLKDGDMVYTVLSRIDGLPGEDISAGLIWGWAESNLGKLGLVITAQQKNIDNGRLDTQLIDKINEMAKNRGMRLIEYKIEKISLNIPKDYYGCAIVAFIYCF